jgi:hypothetical protein
LEAAHDPKGRIARQHGRDRILQAPGEAHLLDHLVHGRAQIEGKPALHGGGHPAAAGLGPRQGLALHQGDAAASGGQMEGGRGPGGATAHHNHIGKVRHGRAAGATGSGDWVDR